MGTFSSTGIIDLNVLGAPPASPDPAIAARKQWLAQEEKAKKEKNETKVIGATDLSFHEMSQKYDHTLSVADALTETLDFTTYPDKAVIRLKNERGFEVFLTQMQIRGNPITRSKGANGQLLLDEMKKDDDIRRNGEKVKEIANDYIIDGGQISKLSDYWYKECGVKKHLYSVQIKGTALWYEPGDWYTFALGGPNTNEYISATVSVVSCDVERSNGTIGSTSLVLRECMESWTKTTLYEARLLTGASPKRRTNQSNTVIVGASDFGGTCDYRCDGTADDVEINAAIESLFTQYGGGEVHLSSGSFNIADTILVDSGRSIIISGEGEGTIIKYPGTTTDEAFSYIRILGTAVIKYLKLDGENTHKAFGLYGIKSESHADVMISNIWINNFYCTGSSSGVSGISCLPDGYVNISNVIIKDLTSEESFAYGIYYADRIYSCTIDSLAAPSGNGYGIYHSNRCGLNRVSNVTGSTHINYQQSYADAAYTYPADDTNNGGFNS